MSSGSPIIPSATNLAILHNEIELSRRIKRVSDLSQLNFGDVFIPVNMTAPKITVLPEFSRLAHGLRSGNITILDSKTIYIPNLHYDGAGPDAYFWVGNGLEPNTFGIKVPNEKNRYAIRIFPNSS